jgi:hypothetical protein
MILIWMSFSASNALADFSMVDSDGDVYQVGHYVGNELHNQKYYVQYVSRDASFPEAEGILYYDDLYQSVKIVVFENNDLFGFTLEGHWHGSGSEIFYLNSDGDTGRMNLFLGNRSARKDSKKARVKNLLKSEK